MKNVKKMLAAIVSFMMITAALAGCGSNGVSESSSDGTTEQEQTGKASDDVYEVYFYNWTSEDNVKQLEEAFNKEYAGKYKFVYEKMADATTLTINTALASGERIDVMTQANQFDLRQRADGGAYMGLKQFFDKEGWDYGDMMGDAIEETSNINGDYYSVPYTNNIFVVFFNKKMFDEAGVEYPKNGWTWQDFKDTALKLTSGSGADKIYGAMVDVVGEDHAWDFIARQQIGNFAYYNEDFTASTFERPEMKQSLQYFADLSMKDQSIVPLDEYMTLKYSTDSNGMQGLYNGKYAMWIAPVSGCMYLNANYGEVPEGTDIGTVDIPTLNGGTPVSICYTSTASIPSNVENPEAAWALLKFICIDHADLFAGIKSTNPGYQYKNPEEAKTFNDIILGGGKKPGLDYDMGMETLSEKRTLVSRDNIILQGQAKVNDLMDATMTLVFNGELGVDEALEQLKTKADEAIADDLAKMK